VSWISAITLTAGDDWSLRVFVKLNISTQAIFEIVTVDAAVSTSCPPACVHAPAVPKRLSVDATAKTAVPAVCEPVRPEIVTVDPVGRSQLAVNVTVSMLTIPDTGVLCWIDFVLKAVITTKSGFAPFVTPYTLVLDATIAADVKDAVPDAATLMV